MYDEEGAPALDGKLKLYGFNNLTKALSFNIYDICYAKSAREQRDYIKYIDEQYNSCLLYTSPSPRDSTSSRMPSSA